MLLYGLSIYAGILGALRFLDAFEWRRLLSWERSSESSLVRVEVSLTDFIEALESGRNPPAEDWGRLGDLSAPWGRLCFAATDRLRKSGSAVLPTLRRIRDLVRFLLEAGAEAGNRSAQANAQALACGLMVPVLGILLDRMMPGVSEQRGEWMLACGTALLLTAGAGLTLLRMVDEARWGGLSPRTRPWVIESLVALERLLGAVRAGTPPDLAWVELLEELSATSPELARLLDRRPTVRPESARNAGQTSLIFVDLGRSVQQAIHLSFMEGRPCLDRLETALAAFRARWRLQVDRELDLLATRALKPLFLGVAPAILGLLSAAIFLAWNHATFGEGGMG